MLDANPHAAHGARINLEAEYLQEDRPETALALLKWEAPDDNAIRQPWRLQQAAALINLGRGAEARAILAALGDVPPALRPLLHLRRAELAKMAGDEVTIVAELAQMETRLDQEPGMMPEHRISGYYALARYWHRAGTPQRAFTFWQKGHDHLAKSQPFSRAKFESFMQGSMEHFTAARLCGGARASNADTAPVFIVGMPRSGTSLTEQILGAHHAVHGAGERVALSQYFWELGGGDTAAAAARVASLGTPALDARAQDYLRELHALAPDAARIVDKMPSNSRHLGLVSLLMPGARIIECERDPRDIGLSIFSRRFFGMHDYAHDLGDLGWYIGQQRRLMAHWRAALPNPILRVRLQDWVEDFDATLRRVLAFLDLPYDAACETFHESDRPAKIPSHRQVREKINARGLNRWQPFAEQFEPLIATLHETGALEGW